HFFDRLTGQCIRCPVFFYVKNCLIRRTHSVQELGRRTCAGKSAEYGNGCAERRGKKSQPKPETVSSVRKGAKHKE
ncbi:MAG: hypothetical protein ACI4RV_05560, partial [Eubacteriales bacterium]